MRHRVERDCAQATEYFDWAFSCWLVNTDEGHRVGREALEARQQRS